MSVNFTFLQRDAHKPALERAFVDAVLATGKFYRNEHSQIQFQVAPGDYCLVDRKQGLRSIILSGEVLHLDGDLDDAAFDALWIWLTASKWRLPRTNPHVPNARPLPVRHVRDGQS